MHAWGHPMQTLTESSVTHLMPQRTERIRARRSSVFLCTHQIAPIKYASRQPRIYPEHAESLESPLTKVLQSEDLSHGCPHLFGLCSALNSKNFNGVSAFWRPLQSTSGFCMACVLSYS